MQTSNSSHVVAFDAVSRMCVAFLLLLMSSSCSPPMSVNPKANILPHLAEKHYVSHDGDHFGYRNWQPVAPHTVIIGIHGISGHSGDYKYLTKHLRSNDRGVAIYAPEIRGQGMDANKKRRGDIMNSCEWTKDLYTFTSLVRKAHPKARIIWLGESMGTLIIMHAYHTTPHGFKKPDALIFASPIVDISSKISAWKLGTMRVAAFLFPQLRISLETLSTGERPVVTKDDIHKEQANKNEWYIPRYTLRLLLTLGNMADRLKKLAADTRCPILILNGGMDIFTSKEKVDELCASFPKDIPCTHHYYKDSFHLLLYDHQREKIFRDISAWLKTPR